MWLTMQERVSLAVLGSAALAALGVLWWCDQRPPLTVAGVPHDARATQWEVPWQEGRRIDVNTAGIAELERLPGVGPALAQRIVDDRRHRGSFQTVEDLSRVSGIGPKTVEALEPYLTTE